MKKKLFFTILILVVLDEGIIGNSLNESLTNFTNTNFRIFPSQYFQIETSITVNPTDPQIMLGTAITGDTIIGGYTTGAYVSTNGGNSWFGTDFIKDASNNVITTIGDPTALIDKNGVFILTYIAPPVSGNNLKAGVSYSTNNGASWSPTIYIPGVSNADKIVSHTDNNSSSLYYGRCYTVYSEESLGIYFSSSTNRGINWTTAKRISPLTNHTRVGANISTGPTGNIYVTWPSPTLSIGFGKSTNGGSNWTSDDSAIPVYPTNDSSYVFFFNSQMVNGLPVIAVDYSGGSRNGWIYVASSEKTGINSPATDECDIILHSSSDEGASFQSQSYKVNQDNTGSLKYQFFPVMNIDRFGGINIIYFDTRNTPTNDSCNVYLSRSLDGGNTFRDILISENKFKPKPIPDLYGLSFYAGSYIGITSDNNKLTALWYDDHTGNYQAWTSSISISPIADIKFIMQGFYDSTANNLNSKDTVKVYLRNSVSPYLAADSSSGILDSLSFTVSMNYNSVVSGNYFLQLKHRNSLETWSKNPVTYSVSSNLNYDFISEATRAFGDNMILINGKYCIYSGDINHDGVIDASDASIVDNAAYNILTGYVIEDCNGDYIVDGTDLLIVDNNLLNSVIKIIP